MDTASRTARLTQLILSLLVYAAHNVLGSPKTFYVAPRETSVRGGPYISIYGREFAEDQFNYFNTSLGHRVEFYNSTTSIECDIVPYLSNNKKITCQARPASEGDYYVRVHKNGKELSALGGSYCNNPAHCRLRYRWGYTPTVEMVTPSSGTPGTVVDIYGRLFTSQYSAQQDEGDSSTKIERVQWGSYICDLVDPETNKLYGITPRSEGHQWGTMRAMPQGNYVASQTFDFKVSNNKGWSFNHPNSLQISGKNKLYHYQTHADITGVSPSSGSLEGGTLLTISGNYFYDQADTKVLVGGVPCDVVSVSDTEITCITNKAAETSATLYPGDRGAVFDKWNSAFGFDDDEWNTTSPNLTEYILEAASPQNIDDQFVARVRGMFVPPRDGFYRMAIISDDSSVLLFSNTGDDTNLTKVAGASRYTGYNWFRYPDQLSKRLMLKGGHPYYFEGRYREYGGGDWVRVGAMMYDAPFVSSDTESAFNEVQRIEVISDVDVEIQFLTIEGANEVQQVRVAYTGCGNYTFSYNVTCETEQNCTDEEVVEEKDCELSGSFKLAYDGMETGTISVGASAEEVEDGIASLSSLEDIDYDVDMTMDDLVWTYTVEFHTHEDLLELTVSVSDADTAEAEVTELSPGTVMDDNEEFVITYDNKDTQSLTAGSSALEVQDALLDLFSLKCADLQSSAFFYSDFEDEPLGDLSGERVNDVEPFCGRTSLRNPEDVFIAGIKDKSGRNPESFTFSRANKMCFALKGVMSKAAKFTVQYAKDTGELEQDTEWVAMFETEGDYITNQDWAFRCVDLEDIWSYFSYASDRSFTISRIKFAGNQVDNYYIDNFYLGKSTLDGSSWNRQPGANPNGILVSDVNVTKSNNTYEITMFPANCGHDFPLLGIKDTEQTYGSPMADSDFVGYQKKNSAGAIVYSVLRFEAATPPVDGRFTVHWKNKNVTVPVDASAKKMKELVERLGTGTVGVKAVERCYGNTWDIEWTSTGGLQPMIEVVESDLMGNNVSVTVDRLQDGSLMLGPIPGEFLRIPHDNPQVEVMVDTIPSSCSGTCDFTQSEADTPTVTSVTPAKGKSGTSVTISGTGFSTDTDDIWVTIGGISCDVTSATAVSIVCTAGEGLAGNYTVLVSVSPKGFASHPDGDVMFEYTWAVTGVSPSAGSAAGGTPITVTGYGFTSLSSDNSSVNPVTVTVGGVPCTISSITYSQIVCTITNIESSVSRRRKRSTTNVDIKVTSEGGATVTTENAFTLDSSLTPTINSISPTSSSVLGGGVLTITGTEFAASGNKVLLGDNECEIVTESEEEITCTIPPHAPGEVEVDVSVPDKGFAETSQISDFTYKLKVTGLSPNSGSILGGTTLTIDGEGFGTDTSQVKATFDDYECKITKLADEQVTCITKLVPEEHEVSNQGRHEEYGTGYRWEPNEIDIAVGDSVRWWWAVPEAVTGIKFTIQQTDSEDDVLYNGQGFHAGSPSSRGSYSFSFTAPGTYYYSSGPVNEAGDIIMNGIVNVKADSNAKQLEVMVGDFKADHDMSASGAPENADMFTFKFCLCSTPVIESVDPNYGISTTEVEIHGSGFGNEVDQIDVKIGDHTCEPSSVDSTLIKCDIQTEDTLIAGYKQVVSVDVTNLGLAINGGMGFFVLIPSIDSISPEQGSTEGGTQVKITGDGFAVETDEARIITINGAVCVVESASYTEIICVTSRANAGTNSVSLYINNVKAECPNGCSYTYSADLTPNVVSVSPTIVSGADTEITITGTGFASTTEDVTVTIGDVKCTVSSASATEIVCNVGYVPVGDAKLILNISPVGMSTFTESSHQNIWSSKDIFDFNPKIGSRNGGQEVTIDGNGFHADDTTVLIDNKVCEIKSIDISQIKCITPAKSSGEYTLQVTSGIHNYLEQTYTYSNDATPRVNSVNPTSGKSGDSITIDGSGFSDTLLDNTITIDEVECTVTSATSSSIVCDVGVHSAGSYVIMVHVKGKGYALSAIEFEYELSITITSPSTGSFGGGRTLTIEGVGFGNEDTTTVSVCGNLCPILSITATTIECDVPGSSDTGDTLDCVIDVKMTSGAERSTDGAPWQYRRDMTPTITSVSPKRGGTGGGTTLTITGTGFSSSGNKVSIAGTTCEVKTESTTEITCRTGQRSTTVRSKVRVEVGDNGIATQDQAEYYYVDLWSSTFTWGGEDPPIQGDFVVIKTGQSVLLDIDTPVLKMLLIQGGCLLFDDEKESITLNAEYILIVDGGCLQIGTEDEPHQNKATIVMHGHVRSKELPMYGAKTLAVRNGTLDLHGKHIPITWTHLAETIRAGDTQMTLMKSVTWNIDDKIVIASTGNRHSQRENEMLTIKGISEDGLTLTFEPPVKYDHISVVQTIDGVTLETRAEVGLLTRNVVVRGSFHEEWKEEIPACTQEFDTNQFATQTCFQGRFGEETVNDQFGSQIMFFAKHTDQHLSTGRIEYVEVTHAGQAFRLGRYPIHFHLNGNVTGNYVRGCAVHHTFNRAVTIHAVHHLLVEHNVAYNIMGHAYFLEDGIETKNIIQYNLAIFVRPSSSLLNVDVTPAAYWVTNADNYIRHNAAAGGSHFGFWYNAPTHPGGPSFTSAICPRHVPVLEFRNNTVHSVGWYGLWIFPVYYPRQDGSCNVDISSPAEFYDLTAWEIERGAEGVEVGEVRFHNFLISDADKAGIEFQTTKSYWGGTLAKDSAIIGWSELSAANKSGECTEAGLKLPKSKFLTVDNVKFINFDQDRCAAIKACSHCKVDQGGYQARFQNIKYSNVPNKAAWQWEHECWLEDLDGSLTGKGAEFKNYKVLPQNPNLPEEKCEFDMPEFSVGGFPGAICDSTVKFHRMAFNNAVPESLLYKDTLFTNNHGTSRIHYHKKRLTHPFGWMITLIDGDKYNFYFEDVDHVTNISYKATLDDFADGDYVLLNHNFTQTPDHIATIGLNINGSEAMVTYEDNVNGDWFLDKSVNEVTYIVSGKGESEPIDVDIDLDVYQCYYEKCVIEQPPPAPEGRPENAFMWSNPQSWKEQTEGWGSGDGILPQDGADVMIKTEVWMVADTTLPSMGKLYIYGVLELENDRDFVIDAEHILIVGGRLIVGWKDKPYQNNALIRLRGKHSTPEIALPSGPVLGSKALGVFGALQLYGINHSVYWTHLKTTVSPGATTITVVEDTDWKAGDEIVLTTTSYDPWHTETFTIEAVDETTRTFTLNSPVKFKHIAATYSISEGNINTYSMRAEVGLLTRNIKIEGSDYNELFEESFGGRVLVGTFIHDGVVRRGHAAISNVEFYHTGQEGWVDPYDPRYSLVFLNSGEVDEAEPSFVEGCSFHHGFSPAIGLFDAHGVVVSNNVIHHVVGPGVVDWGDGNIFEHNLVALVIFPGTYQDRFEGENLVWCGGFEVHNAKDPVLIDNTVAGSERAGYKIKGEQCLEGAPDPDTAWRGNVAHGALHGIHMYPDSQSRCSLISNFVLYRNYDYGIYFQVRSSVEISNVVLADNHAGVLPLIIGPPAIEHRTSDKYVRMDNSLIIGFSPDFECGVDDDVVPEVASHPRSHSGSVKTPDGGHAGFVFTSFLSNGNGAPFKKFYGAMSYPAISGRTEINNVVFSQFGNKCSKRSYMFMTNKASGDFMHPIHTQGIVKDTVDAESIVFIHRPSLGLVNPSDCVDMDCDAMKKALIRDLDGSLLGSIGTVVPQSEFEWDGDARRGLGDYRIPKVMLTELDGSQIKADNKCPKKGIYGVNDNCVWKSDWQAYECHDVDHMIMIFESLDVDTEVRRLSPMALYTDKYVDLVNGPQDHGWCHGYTCQERISTFYTMVATNQEYEVYFTSTNPQRMRLHLLNANDAQKVVVAIYYKHPQRMDVYVRGLYIMPTNGKLNENGDFIWENEPGKDYKPSLDSSVYGENYFDRDWSMLHILVRGSDPVDLVTSPVLVVSFGVPATSVDDFFEENLIQNLVGLLGVDSSQIRIVNIIAEDSVGRRRRSMRGMLRLARAADTVEVIFEVGDPPADSIETEETTDPDAANFTTMATPVDVSTVATQEEASLSFEALEEVGQVLADKMQTGEMEDAINIPVVSMAITDPEPPPVDPTGGVRATNSTGGPANGTVRFDEMQAEEEAAKEEHVSVVYRIPDHLTIHLEPSGASEREAWSAQPKIKVYDALDVLVEQLGHTSNPWKLTATLRPGTGVEGAQLLGNTSVPFKKGFANFTDLAIDTMGSGYILDFAITYPNDSTLAISSSAAISITKREYYAAVHTAPSVAYVDEDFDVTVQIKDLLTDGFPQGITEKAYTWKASASLVMPTNYPGSLDGSLVATFDLNSAQANFHDLTIDKKGYLYIINFHIYTEPSSDYDFSVDAEGFDVKVRGQAEHSGDTNTLTMRFNANYETVASGNEKLLKANFLNKVAPMYPNVTISNVVISEGSILIAFDIQGDTDSTQDQILEDLSNGLITLSFDGYTLTPDNYLLVDGKEYKSERSKTSVFPIWAIILIVIIVIVMIVVVVFIAYWLCCRKKNKIISETETIPLGVEEEKADLPLQSLDSLNSSHSSVQQGVETPLTVTTEDEALSVRDIDEAFVDSPSLLRKSLNTPRRTPEVAVLALPPGFTEGQDEKLLEDRRPMNLMARNDNDGTFLKLALLSVNLVGSVFELRQDVTTALNSSTWKDKKFVLMKETLKDISASKENHLRVSEVYASDCVLIRWADDNVSAPQTPPQTGEAEKPKWAPVW